MKEIKEDLEKFNKELKEISDKQVELRKEVDDLSKMKKSMKDEFIESKVDSIDKYIDLNKEVVSCISGDNSFSNLERDLEKLYGIAFHGIVHGRIKTNQELPVSMQKYDRDKEIWINTRGIAFKPNDSYYRYWQKKRDATKCLSSFDDIMIILKDYPNLVKFVPKKDKKEIFKAFHKCVKNWKYPTKNSLNLMQKILSFDEDSGYHSGLTSLSLKETNEVKITMNNHLNIEIKNKDSWSCLRRFSLDVDIITEDKFILNQISDTNFNIIKEFVEELKTIHEHNVKLFNDLRNDISEHIMHRLV